MCSMSDIVPSGLCRRLRAFRLPLRPSRFPEVSPTKAFRSRSAGAVSAVLLCLLGALLLLQLVELALQLLHLVVLRSRGGRRGCGRGGVLGHRRRRDLLGVRGRGLLRVGSLRLGVLTPHVL